MAFFGDPAATHPPFVTVVYHMIVQLVADFPEKPLFQVKLFCSRGGRSGQHPINQGDKAVLQESCFVT